jgi:hypothetical protein
MADKFIRQESFHRSNVALVPGILEKATDSGFVVILRHNSLISVARLAHRALVCWEPASDGGC